MKRRRFRPRMTPGMWVGLLALVLIAARLLRSSELPDPSVYISAGPIRAERLVDDNALLLENGVYVRLIGVERPEAAPRVATAAFARQHVEGRQVTLQFARERRDRQHNLVAYVFADDWFLNEELIRAGLARVETDSTYNDSTKRRLRNAEQTAREAKVGIWMQ